MATYGLDITHDFKRYDSGDAHLSFTGRLDWCGGGEWRAAWPLSHPVARDMLAAVAGGHKPRRWGVALTGHATGAETYGFFATRVGVHDGNGPEGEERSIVAEGYADDAVLAGAFGLPQPGTAWPTAAPASAWTVYAAGPWANAEDALVNVVRDNASASALVVARRNLDLTVATSLGRGPAVNLPRRFPTLLEWVREVALLSGLSPRVKRTTSGLQFTVGLQTTKPDVRWAREEGTLGGTSLWWEDSPDGVLVGGKRTTETNELTRQFLYTANPVGTPPPRFPWVVFRDDTATSTLAEMRESALQRLAEETGKPTATVSMKAQGHTLGLDFNLGDLTPVVAGGRQETVRIEAVHIEHRQSGTWLLQPVPGTPLGDPDMVAARLYRAVRQTGAR